MSQSNDLCRLCGQKKKIKTEIFTVGSFTVQKIYNCLNIKVSTDDLLPKCICIECCRILDQFNSFKVKCRRVEKMLNKICSSQSANKIPIVKQEVEEAQPFFHLISLDHGYASTDPCHPIQPSNVKTEVEDEPIVGVITVNTDDEEDPVSNFNVCEIKEPIIEVFIDNMLEDHNEQLPTVCSKIEADIVQVETKPIIVSKSVPESSNSDTEEIENKLGEPETNFELNVDMEEMETILEKKKNPNYRLKCQKCEKTFRFLKALRKHRKTHEGDIEDNSYSCHYCLIEKEYSRDFASLATLKNHIYKQHLSPKCFECGVCQENFTTQNLLESHKIIAHPPIFECLICRKICKNKRLLKSHQRVHSNEKPFACELCGRNFRWSASLQVHLQAHSQIKNFLCAECGKKFCSRRNMLEHLNIHHGTKPFVCPVCGKSYANLASLSKHKAKHREKRYSCSDCSRAFTHKYILKQHQTIHNDGKPFACDLCGAEFRTKLCLIAHKRTHGDKKFSCIECGMMFSRSAHLRDHMVRHTGLKHLCPSPGCGKSYSQRYPLNKHIRKHHPGFVIISGHKRNMENCLPQMIQFANQSNSDVIPYT